MGGILLSLTGSGWADRHGGRGSWWGPGAMGLQLTLCDPLISCCLNQASARLQLQTLIDLGILDEMAFSLMHQGALPLLDPVAGKWERDLSVICLSLVAFLKILFTTSTSGTCSAHLKALSVHLLGALIGVLKIHTEVMDCFFFFSESRTKPILEQDYINIK